MGFSTNFGISFHGWKKNHQLVMTHANSIGSISTFSRGQASLLPAIPGGCGAVCSTFIVIFPFPC